MRSTEAEVVLAWACTPNATPWFLCQRNNIFLVKWGYGSKRMYWRSYDCLDLATVVHSRNPPESFFSLLRWQNLKWNKSRKQEKARLTTWWLWNLNLCFNCAPAKTNIPAQKMAGSSRIPLRAANPNMSTLRGSLLIAQHAGAVRRGLWYMASPLMAHTDSGSWACMTCWDHQRNHAVKCIVSVTGWITYCSCDLRVLQAVC